MCLWDNWFKSRFSLRRCSKAIDDFTDDWKWTLLGLSDHPNHHFLSSFSWSERHTRRTKPFHFKNNLINHGKAPPCPSLWVTLSGETLLPSENSSISELHFRNLQWILWKVAAGLDTSLENEFVQSGRGWSSTRGKHASGKKEQLTMKNCSSCFVN